MSACKCSGEEVYDAVSGRFYDVDGSPEFDGYTDLIGGAVDLIGAEPVLNEVGICVGFNCPGRGFMPWQDAAHSFAPFNSIGGAVDLIGGDEGDLWERQAAAFSAVLFR